MANSLLVRLFWILYICLQWLPSSRQNWCSSGWLRWKKKSSEPWPIGGRCRCLSFSDGSSIRSSRNCRNRSPFLRCPLHPLCITFVMTSVITLTAQLKHSRLMRVGIFNDAELTFFAKKGAKVSTQQKKRFIREVLRSTTIRYATARKLIVLLESWTL